MTPADMADMLNMREWGRQARQNGTAKLGYSRQPIAIYRSSTPNITPAEADKIDKALAYLHRLDIRAHDAVVLAYVCQQTDEAIGRHMGTDRRRAWEWRRNGLRALYDCVFGLQKINEPGY